MFGKQGCTLVGGLASDSPGLTLIHCICMAFIHGHSVSPNCSFLTSQIGAEIILSLCSDCMLREGILSIVPVCIVVRAQHIAIVFLQHTLQSP